MSKQCQSCGMPMRKDSDRGTESDGSLSEKYCSLCYKEGKFLAPDATINDMQKIVDDALKEKHWPSFLRRFATKQIPKLERWQ